MTVVTDPLSGNSAAVMPCRSCKQPVYWGYTEKGKRCPFNVVDGQPTRESHFTTCPQARQWSKKP
jgi:hypothetical protein